MDFLQLAKSRHSVRQFSGERIPREKLNRILEAGRFSPSARNSQPWCFYCAESSSAIEDTAKAIMMTGRNAFTEKCGAIIAITEEPIPTELQTGRRFAEYDIGMAVMQMCLEAESLGIGSCILGLYSEEGVKCALDIPEDRKVALLIALGVSAEISVREKVRKPETETVVFR